jgi:3-hydroxyisobutyrate dehydrogenase-like beta-hydroxyacid dehydrogenase
MALRLAQQGFPLVVWNREPERSVALADAGAVLAESPQDVARQCAWCACASSTARGARRGVRPQGIAQAPRRRAP